MLCIIDITRCYKFIIIIYLLDIISISKMNKNYDKENIVPPLTLQSLKRHKEKYYTDRTNIYGYQLQKDFDDLNSTILIEKQKEYSKKIREKNVQSKIQKAKKQGYTDRTINKTINNDERLKESNLNFANFLRPLVCNKFHGINSGEYNSFHTSDKTVGSQSKKGDYHKKTESQIPLTYRTNNSQKVQFGQSNLNHQTYALNFSKASDCYSNILHSSRLQGVQQQFKDKMTINSQIINETIEPIFPEQIKEVQLLRKQNGTYKRDLAYYRKQNGIFKRDIDNCQKQIQELKERNEMLIYQNNDHIQNIEYYKISALQIFDKRNYNIKDTSNNSENANTCEEQLFEAKKIIKMLQFKNYMLQKQFIDSSEAHKKSLAHEVSIWKQRYIKVRNQNFQIKENRNQMLYQTYIPLQQGI